MADSSSKSPSALCEVHPQLRLANLYVKMTHEGALNALVEEECVTLQSTNQPNLRLRFPSTLRIKLADKCQIQPTVSGVYAHLRMPCGVTGGTVSSGSDSVEVIDFVPLTSGFTRPAKMRIPQIEERYRIQCLECEAILVPQVQFQRVLPLPRASWSEAASDWYCHVHAEEDSHPKIPFRTSDCLYGSSFHALAVSLFADGSLDCGSRKDWRCSECQSSVGLASDGLVNLWCHSVQWLTCTDETWTPLDVPTPLEAFYLALYDALEEEKSFFGRKLSFQDPSSRNTLQLWFVGDNGFTLESDCDVVEDGGVLQMRSSPLVRVLYKQSDVEPAGKSKLSDVSEYNASSEMLDSVVHDLKQSSERLPPNIRSAAGYSIGYLPLAS